MDKQNDKISIIVPIYNCEKFLDKCLDSLARQTFDNLEILLIDDGSTDNSANICKKFCDKDNRFIYIYQDNAGVSAARNKGLSLAMGDYIGFCDSDDWCEPDMYEVLYNLLISTNSDISCCAYLKDDNINNFKINNDITIYQGISKITNVIFDFSSSVNLAVWTKLFKANIVKNIKFCTGITIGEDSLFLFDALNLCNKYAFKQVYKYHYVYRENSAINCKFKESYWSLQTYAKKLHERTIIYCSNLEKFANKIGISVNLAISNKLTDSKLLNKQNYLRVKNEIKIYLDRDVKKIMDLKRKIALNIFMHSRRGYIFARKVFNLLHSK